MTLKTVVIFLIFTSLQMIQIYFFSNNSLLALESLINDNLVNISNWLVVNKLSLNVDKTNFVVFHPPQKKSNYAISFFL